MATICSYRSNAEEIYLIKWTKGMFKINSWNVEKMQDAYDSFIKTVLKTWITIRLTTKLLLIKKNSLYTYNFAIIKIFVNIYFSFSFSPNIYSCRVVIQKNDVKELPAERYSLYSQYTVPIYIYRQVYFWANHLS